MATPVTVDLDIAKRTNWTYDKEFAYGKFTIKLTGALSSSISFDKFYLPKNTELFVYNENGNMITGPVTEKENNPNKIWGSWVYRGEFITIETKTPIATMNELILHSDNIAYGYKEIYKSIKVGGFGQSGPCNINVICPLGNGWEAERNSVSTILSANGSEFCTGSLVMNTCSTNQPFYLTANHCFEANSNTAGWRFAFQAWSTTCPNPGVNTNGVMYNSSTLRARNTASDFCLVELNTIPPANSGLHYAGWTRSATPAQNATGIHHPNGDLMKISRANNPVTVGSFGGTINQHWQANWSPQNNGNGQTVTPITEPGSSGSPLFDQNHRIVGQLHGGPSACGATQLWDFYGRFDLSWTGGGTNATRLSNWLDPSNSGAVTTNTTNVASLNSSDLNSYSISGPNEFCTSASYTIPAAALCIGGNVTWSLGTLNNHPNVASLSCTNCATTTLTKINTGTALLIATVTYPNNPTTYTYQKFIGVGIPVFKGWYNSPTNPQEPLNPWTRANLNATNLACYGTYITTSTDITANANVVWQQSGIPAGMQWYQIGNNLRFIFADINQEAFFTVTVTNSCGTTSIRYRFTSTGDNCSGGNRFNVLLSPNPATNTINVILTDKTDINKQKGIVEIRLVDKMGNIKQTWSYGKSSGSQTRQINVGSLATDIYTIMVFDGISWTSEKFIKQ